MILESFRSKPLAEVSLSLITHYLWAVLCAYLCMAGHPFCVSLQTVDKTRQFSVSLCTWTNLMMWSTCRPRGIPSLYLILESIDRASGSGISLPGPYLIVAL